MKKLITLFLILPLLLSCSNDDEDQEEPVEDHAIVGVWKSLNGMPYCIRFTRGGKAYACNEYGIEEKVYYAEYTLEGSVYTVKDDRVHIVRTVRFKESGLIDDISLESKYEILNHHPDDAYIEGAFLITEYNLKDDKKETCYYQKVE
ncbi:hypothetical protein GGR21_003393 [Dysgonomonas hofstadii]|uniref:Uncharacterized protein n=1 Tax=Dysgonomonas hofstadii TaxID=637886 RepID=A0A840CPY2_9BACT|nr:hypothetical protein [Dysgonomonas hofstadii]MBB4037476.1 hypothetical protein [Dysgonomonas hofstadii]